MSDSAADYGDAPKSVIPPGGTLSAALTPGPTPGPTAGDISKATMESSAQQDKLKAAGDELVKSTEASAAARHAAMLQRPPIPPPTPPPEMKNANPIEAWGSLAMGLAIMGSAFTRRPLLNSLNAAAEVMKAHQKGDADAYKTAFERWKAQSDYSLKVYEYQHDSYKDALDMIATDSKGALALFNAKAAALGDDPIKRLAEAAKLPEIVALAEERTARTAQLKTQNENASRTGAINQEVLDAGNAYRKESTPENLQRYQAAQQAKQDLASGRPLTSGAGREQEIERAVQEKDRQWAEENGSSVPPDVHYQHRLDAEAAMKSATATPTAKNQAAKAFSDEIVSRTGKSPTYADWAKFSQDTSGSQTGKLSEDAVELMARQYELGDMGVITSLPRGGPARIQVENKIAEHMKAMDDGASHIVMNRLRMAEAKSAATTAGRVTMNTALFSQEAKGAGQEVVRTSKLFPRTEIPLVNQALRAYETNTGDPKVIQFGIAMNALVNAYGKMSNPTGTGIHDADKDRFTKILDTSLSQGQVEAGVEQVIKEGEIVAKAAHEAQTEVLHRIMPGGSAAPTPSAPAAAATATPSAPAPSPTELPPAARAQLQDGHETTFENGQVWTLENGQPKRVR